MWIGTCCDRKEVKHVAMASAVCQWACPPLSPPTLFAVLAAMRPEDLSRRSEQRAEHPVFISSDIVLSDKHTSEGLPSPLPAGILMRLAMGQGKRPS